MPESVEDNIYQAVVKKMGKKPGSKGNILESAGDFIEDVFRIAIWCLQIENANKNIEQKTQEIENTKQETAKTEQTIIDLSQKKNTRVIFLGKVSINPQDYFYQIRQ